MGEDVDLEKLHLIFSQLTEEHKKEILDIAEALAEAERAKEKEA
jgi:hypothetical protein